jgi:hypothetical protein
MPSQGWVKFDPTPRTDGINPPAAEDLPFRAADHLEAAQSETRPRPEPGGSTVTTVPTTVPFSPDGGLSGEAPSDLPARTRSLVIPLLVLAIALMLVPSTKWLRRRRRLRLLERGDVSGAWQEIVDRLADLGAELHRSETPAELATEVGPMLAPLADVYAESAYGPAAAMSSRRIATATRSLADTEAELTRENSIFKRIRARYRVRSLRPRRR